MSEAESSQLEVLKQEAANPEKVLKELLPAREAYEKIKQEYPRWENLTEEIREKKSEAYWKVSELERKIELSSGPLGLMDGGIVDNQGIRSVLLSEKRRNEGKPEKQFDLLFISDVSSPNMKQFEFAEYAYDETKKNRSGESIKKTLSWIKILFISLSILSLISLVIFLFSLSPSTSLPSWTSMLSLGLGAFLMAPCILYLLGIRWIKDEIQKGHQDRKGFDPKKKYTLYDFVPDYYASYIPSLEKIKFSYGKRMLEDRAKSVLSMVSDVFLKQVRRLIYDQVYEDDAWKYRRLSNFIYELKEDELEKKRRVNFNKFKSLQGQLGQPSETLSAAAEKASSMGTTLWFTQEEKEEDMIEYLIACGQFSACFNLLEYLMKLKKNDAYQNLDQQYREDLDGLYTQLLDDWNEFNKKPMRLIEAKSLELFVVSTMT